MLLPLISLLIFLASAALVYLSFRSGSGWIWRIRKKLSLSDRVLKEDALKYFTNCELDHEAVSLKGLAGCLALSEGEAGRIVGQLTDQGLLTVDGTAFRLTAEGRMYGLRVIRAHRLYETYMSETSGLKEHEWHIRADKAEHRLTEDQVRSLDQRLNYPVHDPHGDPIPSPNGKIRVRSGKVPMNTLKEGAAATIVHMEDEPAEIYSQLIAEGLYPGLEIQILETGSQRIRFWGANDEHVLSPLIAASVQVVPAKEKLKPKKEKAENAVTMAQCRPGVRMRVLELSQRISGTERRRLMDLGFLPGTEIELEYTSASGDPLAFRVRGTLIALRQSQAEQILVEELKRTKKEGAA